MVRSISSCVAPSKIFVWEAYNAIVWSPHWHCEACEQSEILFVHKDGPERWHVVAEWA